MTGPQTLMLSLDADDAQSIDEAVRQYQTTKRTDGQLMLSDGVGDLKGRILAEICRGWQEYNRWFVRHRRNDVTGYWEEHEPEDEW